jgi:hypothetical protein
MACAICKLDNRGEIDSFPTEAAFISTARKINELIDKNDMICLRRHFGNAPFDQSLYQCRRCGQYWLLEAPDQAFRGSYRRLDRELA